MLRAAAGIGHENPGLAAPHSARESCRSHSASMPPPAGGDALGRCWAVMLGMWGGAGC